MRLFITIAFVFFYVTGSAQQVNEYSIIVDAEGNKYSFNIFKQLMATGQFNVRKGRGDTVIMYKRSEKDIMAAGMPEESPYFRTGASFKNFTAVDMEGKKYTIKELRGKVVVLNYWFIGCPPCRMEMPHLNDLVDEFKSKDVVFLGIALDNPNELAEFFKNFSFKYTIIPTGDHLAMRDGIEAFPTHVVIDKNGKILFHTAGYSASLKQALQKSIKKALGEQEI